MAATTPFLNVGAPEGVSQDEIRIPGPAGPLRALRFLPEPEKTSPRPTLLYLHGGGWVFMTPESHARVTKEIALGADACVVSLDYRLAPENPYPAGLEDCLAAFRWLRDHATELGGDPERIAVGGDSAGGNLTAALTLRLQASGEKVPEADVMICPAVDAAGETESHRTFAPDDPVLDAEIMEYFRDCYLSSAHLRTDPYVSPLRGDLSGFPPTCIVVGGIDPLADDGRLFAEKLEKAGREVVLLDYAGMPHIFMVFPGIEAGRRSIDDVCAFLRRVLT